MFRSGRFVADALGDVDGDQVQPNGVDLRLGAVYEQVEPGRVGTDGKTVGERREVEPDASGENGESDTGGNGSAVYALDPGGYVVEYADAVRIPEGHVGFLYPRSSLLRNSCMLDTAVWDAGYEGRGEGLLEVYHPVELERDARIAQLVLAEANHADTYDGSYQGEGLK
ncbi:MAG: deoxyuridine 5'-triphosphate nucleotidohydrolase [Halosimplex sp.]